MLENENNEYSYFGNTSAVKEKIDEFKLKIARIDHSKAIPNLFGFPLDNILDESSELHAKVIGVRDEVLGELQRFESETFDSLDQNTSVIQVRDLLEEEEYRLKDIKRAYLEVFDSLLESMDINSNSNIEPTWYIIAELQMWNIFFGDDWSEVRAKHFEVNESKIYHVLAQNVSIVLKKLQTMIRILSLLLANGLTTCSIDHAQELENLKTEVQEVIDAAVHAITIINKPIFIQNISFE